MPILQQVLATAANPGRPSYTHTLWHLGICSATEKLETLRQTAPGGNPQRIDSARLTWPSPLAASFTLIDTHGTLGRCRTKKVAWQWGGRGRSCDTGVFSRPRRSLFGLGRGQGAWGRGRKGGFS